MAGPQTRPDGLSVPLEKLVILALEGGRRHAAFSTHLGSGYAGSKKIPTTMLGSCELRLLLMLFLWLPALTSTRILLISL